MSTNLTNYNTKAHNKPEVHTPRIAMREIKIDQLEDVDDNVEAVRFPVTLSEAPPEIWIQEFELTYQRTPYSLKPPVTVNGDRLEIVFLPRYSGELQGYFQFLGVIIQRANDEYHITAEMHASNAQELRKAQFREALKRIEVPQTH